MEQEDLGQGFQKGKAESGADPWFGPACDEKLHQWRLLDESSQDRKDCRSRLIIDALVQRINNDDAWDVFLGEWFHEQVLELSNKGSVSYGGVLLDDVDDAFSKAGIMTCELVCKSRKDIFEFPPVEVVSRTEEAGAEESIIGERF